MTGKLNASVSSDGSPARTSTPKRLASMGAKIAITTKNTTIAKQTIAILSARSRASAIWTGERPAISAS